MNEILWLYLMFVLVALNSMFVCFEVIEVILTELASNFETNLIIHIFICLAFGLLLSFLWRSDVFLSTFMIFYVLLLRN